MLALAAPAFGQGSPIEFSVVSDVPYDAGEEPDLQQHVIDHNLFSPSTFLTHLGDLKPDELTCPESDYASAAGILGALAVPTFVVPGDNEWTDCSDQVQGFARWNSYFLGFEENFCGAPQVESQGARPENFAFVQNGVLFIGIHHVGGVNQDPVEQAARLQDDAAWVSQQLVARQAVVRAAVVFSHESPQVEPFESLFRPAVVTFGKPVAYIHGDNRAWKFDSPFLEPNLTRIQLDRGTLAEPPVRVTVTMDPDPTLTFVAERDPWPGGSTPLNRTPCVDAGPDQLGDVALATSLDGRASDDGVPAAVLTTTWSAVAGPGGVAFGDAFALATTATFSAPGTYQLRLSADDGALAATSDLYVLVHGSSAGDADSDGETDDLDNCPATANAGQSDFDGDGFGDDCDPDLDGDGYRAGEDCNDADAAISPDPITVENCSDTIDNNCDGSADAADLQCGACPPGFDADLDGVCDWDDICPADPDPAQLDSDGDGFGDACDVCPASATIDADPDGDDVCADNCPSVWNPGQEDVDGDGVGDVCDTCDLDGTGGTCAPIGAVFESAITDPDDDGEEREATGAVTLTSSDLDIVNDNGTLQLVAVRFPGVAVPAGTTIRRAYLQFVADEADGGPASVMIEAEASDDSAPLDTADFDLSSRVRSVAWAGWSPPDWTTIGEGGALQRTSDLSPLVQEIVDRPGWSSGSAMTLLISALDLVSNRVAESRDGSGTKAPRLHVEYNIGPVVVINSPADGASAIESSLVSFAATANDAEDGDLGASISWSSDLDGPIGSGETFGLSTLSVGTHAITASAADGFGAIGFAAITFHVIPNTPPVVGISSPANGAALLEGEAFLFTGSANDAEDGNLGANLAWSSDLDGSFGSGTSFSSALSVGTHTVTASVLDGHGAPGSAMISVTVLPNDPPVVTISSPLDGAGTGVGALVAFAGSASDVQDGGLTAGLAWTSSLDGAIGSGGGFSSSTLSVGIHTITATVTDSHGDPGFAAVTFTVVACPVGTDPDLDGICGASDNCPLVSNPGQADLDGDGEGDVCDACPDSATIEADLDGDGLCIDNCAATPNPDQLDGDGDGVGDVCDVCLVDGDLLSSCAPVGTEFVGLLSGGGDDGEENVATGAVSLTSDDLDLVTDSGDQFVLGLRYPGVAIPQGSTIHHASLQFQAHQIDTGLASLRIEAEDSDDSPPLNTNAFDLSTRTPTTAWAGWSPPDWLRLFQRKAPQRTPELASVLQELVDRPGWSEGSAMTFLISGIDPTSKRTARARDLALSGSTSLHVEYTPHRPVVSISLPADGGSASPLAPVDFAATALDTEDGDVSASLVWTSDLDGSIGSGGAFTTSALSPGVHTITATAIDGDGNPGSATIGFTVMLGALPAVTIDEPLDGSSSQQGTPLTFTGSALDAEDGDLSGSVAWSSDLDGPIGAGASFSTSSLTEGTHVVTASAIDSHGQEGSAAITTIRLPEPGSEGLLAGLAGLAALARRRLRLTAQRDR